VHRTALEFWRNNSFSPRTIRDVFPHLFGFCAYCWLTQAILSSRLNWMYKVSSESIRCRWEMMVSVCGP
jgi:hypothetical protein